MRDSKFQAIFDEELAYMREMLYERGYNAKKHETLMEATKEQQDKWMKERDDLFMKDKAMDHAFGINLSYKGSIVDHKLNNLRQ